MRCKVLHSAILLSVFVVLPRVMTNAQDGEKESNKPVRIAVVVSQRNPVKALDMNALRRVFLRQQAKWTNSETITVFERHTESPIREQFSRSVLGKKPSELSEYWLNLKLTRGLKPPKTCRSPGLVKRYLERVKGGISYLYEHEVDETVKVVTVLEVKDVR